MGYTRLAVLGLIFGISAPSNSFAVAIMPADIGATFSAVKGGTPAIVGYDSITDLFTIDSDLGPIGDPVFLRTEPTGTLIASDILGIFSLSANIDATGTLLGGDFLWTGESATLGIGPGTTLLAGTLEVLNVDFALGGPQFLASLTTVNSTFGAAVGSVRTLLISQCCTGFGGLDDPWSASWGPGDTASSGPDLFGSPNKIPEPGTLMLFSVALIGLGFLARRRSLKLMA